MLFLRLYFRDEGHFYAKCLLHIWTTYPKCHLFHFFSRGIRLRIPILTRVQNGRICLQKDRVFLLKKFFLNLHFNDEGHLYANYLF